VKWEAAQGIDRFFAERTMAEDKKADRQVLTLYLPENLAKRLNLAATRAKRSPADTVLEILDRHLPGLEPTAKRVPYA
jgi:hypothetical protein